MTTKAIKQNAQDIILQAAMSRLGLEVTMADEAGTYDLKREYFDEMRKQIARIEVLFGYKPGSFSY